MPKFLIKMSIVPNRKAPNQAYSNMNKYCIIVLYYFVKMLLFHYVNILLKLVEMR
jgi:hypothetical protein